MTFKAEHKKLNSTGTEALRFYENQKDVKYETHESFKVMRILNRYFESKNLTAKAFNGTDPKTGNIALLIYSGPDGDFDFEGRVLWSPSGGHTHLTDALELLGINCHV